MSNFFNILINIFLLIRLNEKKNIKLYPKDLYWVPLTLEHISMVSTNIKFQIITKKKYSNMQLRMKLLILIQLIHMDLKKI